MNEAKAAIIAALITAIATLLATFITVYQPMKARFAALENKLADNEEETGAYTASSNTQAEITLQNAVILVVLALAIFYGCFYRPVRKELTELQKKLAGELPAHDPKGCKISSIDELYNNIIMNMAGSFYLSNDIDVAAEQGTWTPLGWQNDGDHIPFTGTLDGQGYTIRGLKNANDSMGLFQVLSGTVRNLHVDVNFSGGNGGAFAVSMTNNGLIECCEASGNIQTNVGCLIGGFVGTADKGIIKNCLSLVSLNAPQLLKGGIIGKATESSVIHCFFKGKFLPLNLNHSSTTYVTPTSAVMVGNSLNCTVDGCHYYCGEDFHSEIGANLRREGMYKNEKWDWTVWKMDEQKEVNDGFPYLRIFKREYETTPAQ